MIGVFCLLGPALLTSASGASADETRIFRIYRKDIAFTVLADSGVTITSNCVAGGKLRNCAASAALKKVNAAKLDVDLFGRDPGAVMCSSQAGGVVVWSHDTTGRERTFCQFKDGSMVSSGTLARFGKKNERK